MMVVVQDVHSAVCAEMRVHFWSLAMMVVVVLAERSVWSSDMFPNLDYRGLLRNQQQLPAGGVR